jgi:hypothetical protein
MQINRIGIRVSIFCITFLFGFLTVEWVVSDDNKFISNEIEQKTILKQNVEFSRTPVEQYATEPPCEEYFNRSKYNDLLREEARINKLLLDKFDKFDKMESSQSQNLSGRKLEKLAKEIKSLTGSLIKTKDELSVVKSLEKLQKTLRNAQKREHRGVHTLLYIENCTEYR